MKNLATWLQLLISAALSGAANSLVAAALVPEIVNFKEGLTRLGLLALFGAVIGVANFVRQSPLPKEVK